tara:strand:- start:7 stop:288 length:282 start_codon:yes stop_codon:yes gene_type:complete
MSAVGISGKSITLSALNSCDKVLHPTRISTSSSSIDGGIGQTNNNKNNNNRNRQITNSNALTQLKLQHIYAPIRRALEQSAGVKSAPAVGVLV